MHQFKARAMRTAGQGIVAALLAATPMGTALAKGVPGMGTWETTLLPRDLDGDGTVEAWYDTALDITWLADPARGGYTSWAKAVEWAAVLNVKGVRGWRLPIIQDTGPYGCDPAPSGTDCGFNPDVSTSELAHLYYVTLGNLAYRDALGKIRPAGWGLVNTGPFTNLVNYDYWSGREFDAMHSWLFSMHLGAQTYRFWRNPLGVWAVWPGDVALAPRDAH